ncbi:hypothetical protein K3G63_22030 [Hymenobacter sp. HSC-4F20]|uniref:hypothetical protein n=1 Tax=Hymenobacter sp. HSC-4F20 TaxID=2864135 RepID=UPI001C73249D|nr:hypothetical protein [Hymenobacter sp. HSC-4F20]MBX0293140.1 hypothetical protein [Hymenobacter sp. HSC-4F20]
MATTNLDYLTRLQNVLIEAKQEYDVLQYISLDGMIEVTAGSAKRTVKIALQPGPAVAVFTELSQAAYERVQELEKELTSAINEFGDEIGADHPLIVTARALANGQSIPTQFTAPISRAGA